MHKKIASISAVRDERQSAVRSFEKDLELRHEHGHEHNHKNEKQNYTGAADECGKKLARRQKASPP